MHFFVVHLIYLSSALFLSACIIVRWGSAHVRRVLAILLDVTALTYVFVAADKLAAPLFFLYLWITIGYGFRFGRAYLFVALALSLTGFGFAITYVAYWKEHLSLSLGLWMGMLLISLYASTLVGRLKKALDAAEVANQAKRQFICSVSHELRTPLNAIIGIIELMKTMDFNQEQRDMLTCMASASHIMLSQIEDVLDFSKIEAGKMLVENTDFDLYKLIYRTTEIFRYRIDPITTKLTTHLHGNLPVIIRGDPSHLRQILVNLIGNAVKFTEKGRISLSVYAEKETDASVDLYFSLKDTGIGIPKDAQEKIFDSFAQASEAISRRYGGTGLGTAICKQLVELMGGEIGLHSEAGVGSEFWFRLRFDVVNEKNEPGTDGIVQVLALFAGKDAIHPLTMLANAAGAKLAITDRLSEAEGLLEAAFIQGVSAQLVFIFSSRQHGEFSKDSENSDQLIKVFCKKYSNYPGTSLILVANADESIADAVDRAEQTECAYVISFPLRNESFENLCRLSRQEVVRKISFPHISTQQAIPTSLLQNRKSSADFSNSLAVLIVEDNPTSQKVLQKILEQFGHRCVLAASGEEALDLAEKNDFDAIIADMNMPGMNGIDFVKAYRYMKGKSAYTPIVMFSANVTPEARQESLDAGASEFLPKPIKIDVFIDTLRRLVSYQRKQFSDEDFSNHIDREKFRKLFVTEENSLSIETLLEIEEISSDPKFLDELLLEFMSENRKLLNRLEQSFFRMQIDEIKDALHSLKGSALSVGALSLKIVCKRIEKLTANELHLYSEEIFHGLLKKFNELCVDIQSYRKSREQMEKN